MQPVLSAEEMRWCDEATIQKHGIPGYQLMENAGQCVVEVLLQHYAPLKNKYIVIFCGKGNNGGDGLVIARHLVGAQTHVMVILLAASIEFNGDAERNYRFLTKLAAEYRQALCIKPFSNRLLTSMKKPDLIIDAMFGTGFSGTARKPASDIIQWINAQKTPVVAVDIPSGVNGTTGVAEGEAIHAERTVTFAALKTGLLCNAGREVSGFLHCTNIGIPDTVLHHQRIKTFLTEAEDVDIALPKRSLHAHKYSVGKVFVLAGSKGLTGAAALTCTAAMRSGAGAVILGTPKTVYPILAKKLTEVMVYPLSATDTGTLAFSAWNEIETRLRWADVILVGPGLSHHPETQQIVAKILSTYKKKVLLDADGLNASTVFMLRSSKANVIITPHVGEFSRLTNDDAREIEGHRIDAARALAKKIRKTVVLKGVPTVIASPNGKAFLNSTGNPGMATAGSGDVLSGIIAGLWAQGMDEAKAAYSGVFLHGRSGDLAAEKLGERSLIASDLIKYLPVAFHSIR